MKRCHLPHKARQAVGCGWDHTKHHKRREEHRPKAIRNLQPSYGAEAAMVEESTPKPTSRTIAVSKDGKVSPKQGLFPRLRQIGSRVWNNPRGIALASVSQIRPAKLARKLGTTIKMLAMGNSSAIKDAGLDNTEVSVIELLFSVLIVGLCTAGAVKFYYDLKKTGKLPTLEASPVSSIKASPSRASRSPSRSVPNPASPAKAGKSERRTASPAASSTPSSTSRRRASARASPSGDKKVVR